MTCSRIVANIIKHVKNVQTSGNVVRLIIGRSWIILQNEYSVATFRFDTAEIELSEVTHSMILAILMMTQYHHRLESSHQGSRDCSDRRLAAGWANRS